MLTAEKTMHHAEHVAHDLGTSVIFGASSIWYLGMAIYRGLPSWEMVPPILLGVVAVSREARAWYVQKKGRT